MPDVSLRNLMYVKRGVTEIKYEEPEQARYTRPLLAPSTRLGHKCKLLNYPSIPVKEG